MSSILGCGKRKHIEQSGQPTKKGRFNYTPAQLKDIISINDLVKQINLNRNELISLALSSKEYRKILGPIILKEIQEKGLNGIQSPQGLAFLLGDACSQLEKLDARHWASIRKTPITPARKFSKDHMESIRVNFTGLKTLILGQITNECVIILKDCPSLTSLEIDTIKTLNFCKFKGWNQHSSCVLEGQFIKGKLNGIGHINLRKEQFKGNFSDGDFNGQGIYIFYDYLDPRKRGEIRLEGVFTPKNGYYHFCGDYKGQRGEFKFWRPPLRGMLPEESDIIQSCSLLADQTL